jgi:hypothetical protein
MVPMPDIRTIVIPILLVLVGGVGLVDSAAGAQRDSAVLFALVALFGGILCIRTGRRRRVTLRSDLARWVTLRANVGGEPVSRVVDRAVSAYRAQLVGDPGSTAGEERS